MIDTYGNESLKAEIKC